MEKLETSPPNPSPWGISFPFHRDMLLSASLGWDLRASGAHKSLVPSVCHLPASPKAFTSIKNDPSIRDGPRAFRAVSQVGLNCAG